MTAQEAAEWRAGNGKGGGATVNLTIYTQELTEPQMRDICRIVNEELGKEAV